MLLQCRSNDNWNKVEDKEKLENWLNDYKGVLSKPMLEYLNSLINLEFSVVRNNIDEKDRKILSELSIYDRIAIYNIYKRALLIFNNTKRRIKIYDNNNGVEGVFATTGGTNEEYLFKYNYDRNRMYYVPGCGEISIIQYIDNKDLKEQEIDRLRKKIKNSSMGSLYPDKDFDGTPLVGANSYKISQYYWEIKTIKEKIADLESSMKKSSKQKRMIELSKEFHDTFLEDYGLKESDFKSSNKESSSKIRKKTLIYQPKLSITRDVNYI